MSVSILSVRPVCCVNNRGERTALTREGGELMSEAIEIESIHRYQAKPGDTIILTLGGRLGPEQTHRLVDLLKDKWPGNSVVILPVGARMEVVGNGA